MEITLLFNPYAGNGKAIRSVEALEIYGYGEITETVDMTEIEDYAAFFRDRVDRGFILCGGDGTLNRFVNDTRDMNLPEEIYYFAAGTGNDFLRDVRKDGDECIHLAPYIRELPVCMVHGKCYRFLNGIGFGIDGFCCEKGDDIRRTTDKPVNYAAIAIRGVLGGFSPVSATVVVDGKIRRYTNVWIASAMKGRYYGGGMMAAPMQNRLDPEGKLSLFVFRSKSRLKTLRIFPSIFTGGHVEYTDSCEVIQGKDITVLFSRPTALQIDGETLSHVTEYRVVAKESMLFGAV